MYISEQFFKKIVQKINVRHLRNKRNACQYNSKLLIDENFTKIGLNGTVLQSLNIQEIIISPMYKCNEISLKN